jgi:hypothetical protein
VLPSTPADEPAQAALPDNSRACGIRKPTVKRLPSQPLRGFVFQSAIVPQAPAEKPKRVPKPKVKNDPKFIAAARELRDRWLERVNADPSGLLSQGKYDVSKQLAAPQAQVVVAPPGLPALIAA